MYSVLKGTRHGCCYDLNNLCNIHYVLAHFRQESFLNAVAFILQKNDYAMANYSIKMCS